MKLLTATQRNNPHPRRPPGNTSAVATVLIAASTFLIHALAAGHLNAQTDAVAGLTNVRVRMVNGSSIRATIESIDESGVMRGSELINGITLDQIISIDSQRKSEANDELPFLTLQLGGRQPFSRLTLDDEAVHVEVAAATSRKFPLELVQSIIFASSQTVAQAIAGRTADRDRVVVDTRSGEKIVQGLVEAIDDTHVILNFDGKSRRIALEKVRAVIMAKLDVSKAVGTAANIQLIDGSEFAGVVNSMNAQHVHFLLSQSHRLAIKCGDVRKISFQSDRVVYLSDLSTLREEQQTQFAAARPWQRDQSLLGNPLQLKFNSSNKILTFDKGIGTRSYTSLVFPNDGFDTFQAVVGIDVETEGHGDCEMVVTGDGIRLWSSRVRAADDPQQIKLDIKGIEEVTLTVFPGEKFDLADHADWADARFTRN